MAKLKAPLLSLGAAGAIGKSIVFFAWKGIDAVREYVVPANPKTTDQTTQRGYLTSAVTEFHGAAYFADDLTAWNRLAGISAKIMSGFNRFCQEFINEIILGNVWERLMGCSTSVITTTGFTVYIRKAIGGNAPTLRWGTSKTFFPNSATMVYESATDWKYAITGLTTKTLYYFTIDVGTSASDWGRTGIYQQRTS